MSPVVNVVVPARPDYVRVLRAVAASLAARLDFTYDRIEDLKLAVSEACATLLALPWPASVMVFRVDMTDTGVHAVVGTDAEAHAGWPPPDLEDTLAWRVLSGLADETAFEMIDEGPAVRIVVDGGRR